MQRSSVKGILIGAAALGTAAGAPAPLLAAEVVETDDYVAVIIEAEDFVTIDERWVPTDATTAPTPETDPDPDGNHSDGASGGAYLEVLPDYRQKHELTVPEGTPLSESLWGKPGTGPTATYAVNFPEPGRYYTHVRAYTTGTEDNGIHIGLNGQWPSSGAALQICTAAARDWRWSNKKRDSGGQSCGIRDTIWLTVEEAGPATVAISAREDGFEIDRMMLIKDRSDNTKNCAPVFDQADRIACADGGIDTADDLVDLAVAAEGSIEEGVVGDRIVVTATLGNRDRFDTARGVELAVAADAEDWRLVDAADGCEREGNDVVCTIGEVRPAPADEDESHVLTFEALRAGLLRLDVSARANEVDDTPDNDGETLLVEIDEEPVRPTSLAVALGGLPAMTAPGTPTVVDFAVDNTGEDDALETRLMLSVPEGLEAGMPPESCSASGEAPTTIDCPIGTLAAGERRAFSLTVSSATEGDFAIGAQATALNAPKGNAVASLDVSEPEPLEGSGGDGGETYGEINAETEAEAEAGEGETPDGTDGGETGEQPVAKPVPTDDAEGGAGGPLLALTLTLFGLARRRAARRPD